MRVLASFSMALLLSLPCAAYAQDEPKPASTAGPQSADSSNAQSKVVYVSDFDLDVPNAKEEKSVPSGAATPGTQSEPKKDESAAEQAREIVDLMSATLVKELQKAGYEAHRLHPGQSRPAEGIGIRGVFAEPDDQNRLRRAVVGAVSGDGKMALFVGVSNLARPEQALYAPADLQNGEKPSDNKPGAVITVSSYVPVAKFEIPKAVNEKAAKDTAAAIVADLTVLLNSNVAALTP